jgi:hypothetical protein
MFDAAVMPWLTKVRPNSAPAVGGSRINLRLANVPVGSVAVVIGAIDVPVSDVRTRLSKDGSELRVVQVRSTPFMDFPDDQRVPLQLTVGSVTLSTTVNIIGYQARVMSISPRRTYTETNFEFTIRMSNFFTQGSSAETYVMFGDQQHLEMGSITQTGSITELKVTSPKLTEVGTIAVRVYPGGEVTREAKYLSSEGSKVAPTVPVKDVRAPRVNSWQLEGETRRFVFTIGGDAVLVYATNYPAVASKDELQVKINGVELPAANLEVLLSSAALSTGTCIATGL